MGIKRFNEVGKKHAPDAYCTIPITWLSGKRIAIDGNNWAYRNMSSARKKVINKTNVAIKEPDQLEIRREWFLIALNFITGWLSNNITPVFVFDGQHPPEKDHTKAQRKDSRVAAKAKIDAMYEQLKGDVLDQPANIVSDLRKELRNYTFIPYEDFELLKIVLKGIGIPCLQARGDGEHLCSALCIEGKVAGVFSADIDNLVFGCPLLITGFSDACSYDEHGFKVDHLDCVRLDLLLSGLKLSHDEFVDLCIMSGCDFNTNMPRCAVGTSYKLIQQYKSIDRLPRNYDTTCLKHVRCREIFKYSPSEELTVTKQVVHEHEDPDDLMYGFTASITENNPLNLNKYAITTARDYLDMAGVSGQIDRLLTVYNSTVPAQDGSVEQLNLPPAPKYVPPIVAPPRLTLNIMTPQPVPFSQPPKLVTSQDPTTGLQVKMLQLSIKPK